LRIILVWHGLGCGTSDNEKRAKARQDGKWGFQHVASCWDVFENKLIVHALWKEAIIVKSQGEYEVVERIGDLFVQRETQTTAKTII
jgi:hypothetical protein